MSSRLGITRIVLLVAAALAGVVMAYGPGAIAGPSGASARRSTAQGANTEGILSRMRIVEKGQTNVNRMHGPVQFRGSLPVASRRGDLLVAAVLCGVVGNDPRAPALRFPPGWHEAVGRVGGFEGGLESAIFYYPANPGGIRRFPVGSVPKGADVWCTVFSIEVAGFAGSVHLDTSGSGQSWGTAVTARTSTPTSQPENLVLLASTDGTEERYTRYTLPSGFRQIQEQHNGLRNQPATLSLHIASARAVQGGTVAWGGATTDGCAVVAAFHV